MLDHKAEAGQETSTQPDDAEQAARLVEGFAEGAGDEVQELLRQIAQAIRDKAWND